MTTVRRIAVGAGMMATLVLAGCSSDDADSAPSTPAAPVVSQADVVSAGRAALGAGPSEARILQLASGVCATFTSAAADPASDAETAIEMAPDINLPTDDSDVSERVNDFVQAAVLRNCPSTWTPGQFINPSPSP